MVAVTVLEAGLITPALVPIGGAIKLLPPTLIALDSCIRCYLVSIIPTCVSTNTDSDIVII